MDKVSSRSPSVKQSAEVVGGPEVDRLSGRPPCVRIVVAWVWTGGVVVTASWSMT